MKYRISGRMVSLMRCYLLKTVFKILSISPCFSFIIYVLENMREISY